MKNERERSPATTLAHKSTGAVNLGGGKEELPRDAISSSSITRCAKGTEIITRAHQEQTVGTLFSVARKKNYLGRPT